MKGLWAAIVVLFLGFTSTRAHAQYAIYAMGSGGFLGSVTATGSFLRQREAARFSRTLGTLLKAGPLRFGGDARYIIESSSGSTPYGNQIRSGLVGPRLALRSHLAPFSPYIQFLIGGASTNYGVSPSRSSSFAYQVQFGLDYAIIPHLDARVEYGGGKLGSAFNGYHTEMQQVGIGIAARF